MADLKLIIEITKQDALNSSKEKHFLKYNKQIDVPKNLINGTNIVYISVPSTSDDPEINFMFECIPVYNVGTQNIDFYSTIKTIIPYDQTAEHALESLSSSGFIYIKNLSNPNKDIEVEKDKEEKKIKDDANSKQVDTSKFLSNLEKFSRQIDFNNTFSNTSPDENDDDLFEEEDD